MVLPPSFLLTPPLPQTLQQHQRVLTGHTGSVLCLQYDEKVTALQLIILIFNFNLPHNGSVTCT